MSRLWLLIAFMCVFVTTSDAQQQSTNSEDYVSSGGYSEDSSASDEQDYSELDDDSSVENFTLEEGQELPRSSRSKSMHKEIELVLSSDDFARKETVTRWRWISADDKEAREEKYPEWLIDFIEWFEVSKLSFSWLATTLEILLWGTLIALIVFVLVRYREQISGMVSNISSQAPEPDLPTTLFGLDVKKDSLPKDVVASAKQVWLKQGPRQAVAVLLRASLIKLLHEYSCRFFDSDTEEECCERIEQQAPQNFSDYMRTLVSAWQRVAYAHIDPSEAQFSELCQQWSEVFDAK